MRGVSAVVLGVETSFLVNSLLLRETVETGLSKRGECFHTNRGDKPPPVYYTLLPLSIYILYRNMETYSERACFPKVSTFSEKNHLETPGNTLMVGLRFFRRVAPFRCRFRSSKHIKPRPF